MNLGYKGATAQKHMDQLKRGKKKLARVVRKKQDPHARPGLSGAPTKKQS